MNSQSVHINATYDWIRLNKMFAIVSAVAAKYTEFDRLSVQPNWRK